MSNLDILPSNVEKAAWHKTEALHIRNDDYDDDRASSSPSPPFKNYRLVGSVDVGINAVVVKAAPSAGGDTVTTAPDTVGPSETYEDLASCNTWGNSSIAVARDADMCPVDGDVASLVASPSWFSTVASETRRWSLREASAKEEEEGEEVEEEEDVPCDEKVECKSFSLSRKDSHGSSCYIENEVEQEGSVSFPAESVSVSSHLLGNIAPPPALQQSFHSLNAYPITARVVNDSRTLGYVQNDCDASQIPSPYEDDLIDVDSNFGFRPYLTDPEDDEWWCEMDRSREISLFDSILPEDEEEDSDEDEDKEGDALRDGVVVSHSLEGNEGEGVGVEVPCHTVVDGRDDVEDGADMVQRDVFLVSKKSSSPNRASWGQEATLSGGATKSPHFPFSIISQPEEASAEEQFLRSAEKHEKRRRLRDQEGSHSKREMKSGFRGVSLWSFLKACSVTENVSFQF